MSKRAQEQERIDTEFGMGRMTKEEWTKRTDELSSLWDENGKRE